MCVYVISSYYIIFENCTIPRNIHSQSQTQAHCHCIWHTHTQTQYDCYTFIHMLQSYAMLNSDRQTVSLFHSFYLRRSFCFTIVYYECSGQSQNCMFVLVCVCVLRRAYFPFVSFPFSLSCSVLSIRNVYTSYEIVCIYAEK